MFFLLVGMPMRGRAELIEPSVIECKIILPLRQQLIAQINKDYHIMCVCLLAGSLFIFSNGLPLFFCRMDFDFSILSLLIDHLLRLHELEIPKETKNISRLYILRLHSQDLRFLES